MNIESKYREGISQALLAIQSLEELADFLNSIQEIRKLGNPHYKFENKEVTVQHLRYVLYSKESKYHTFEIPKKSGGVRTIMSPNRMVKHMQTLLNLALQCFYTPYSAATGFVPGRSIVTNAKRHINKKYVYNIDLENFFPSIYFSRVKSVLSKVPFTVIKPGELVQFGNVERATTGTIHPQIAHYIANICCHEGKLPQGAPTSPTLSNMMCKILDYRLYKFAEEHKMTFTRYADDITFSSDLPVFDEDCRVAIAAIIEKQGFTLNRAKERLQIYGKGVDGELYRNRQEVTGVVVNKRTNVSKKYFRNLKAAIHNWEVKGYDKANELHETHYVNEKGFTRYNGNIPRMELVVGGKLEFLGMVRGKENTQYRLLKLRFDQLCKKEQVDVDYLKQILDLWEEKGLKKAMERYYNRQKNLVDG
jgi:RNA-directed DNA polymerase